jgi:P-type conjugative transfer protein TrbJ
MKMKSYARLAKVTITGLTALSLAVMPIPASAQMAVFDSTNYAQNLLQAARALEQINHQVQSLQNEATMLENMGRNLKTFDFPQLQQITSALRKIDGLMNEAQAIGFKSGAVDAPFSQMFPGSIAKLLTSDQRVAQAKTRLDAAMASFRHSMDVQAEVVSNIQSDSDLLNDLAGRSQSSVGALQAQQAANQLLALSAKQQMQLQDLVAAEFRSQSIERATRAQSEAEARAATQRFLGTGKAYSSTRE